MEPPSPVPRDRNLRSFISHRTALISYARRLVGCPVRAEDVVQDAYVRFDGVASRRLLDQPLPYFLRIIRNLALDSARRASAELRERALPETAECLPADRPSPEAEALYRQEMRIVLDAMEELPERTRMALKLYRLDGHTLKDVAAILGISIGLAHALVSDGIEHCRQRLERRR